MKKRNLYFVLFALLFISFTAYLTNPSKNDYVSFVKQELVNEEQQFAAMIGGPIIDATTTKKNYGLFTIYKTQYNEKDRERMRAIGLFKQFVWLKD